MDDIDDNEVDEGEALGVSLGEPAAVDGLESAVFEVMVRRRAGCCGIAVEVIVSDWCDVMSYQTLLGYED